MLAAASLFHGNVLQFVETTDAVRKSDWAISQLCDSKKPGCVVINALQSEIRSLVYIARGQICGVFCAKDGWVQPTVRSIHKIIKQAKESLEISASVLNVETMADVKHLGFSLTGLTDKPVEIPRRGSKAGYSEHLSLQPQLQELTAYEAVRGLTAENWKTQPTAPKSQQTFFD